MRIKRKNGKVVQGYDVYIGRECTFGGWNLSRSEWANPYRIGRDGTREDVIEKYKAYVERNNLKARIQSELKGKVLGCWCKPLACHGDVLVEIANAPCEP